MSLLDENLAALETVSPALAARIRATPVPEGFERVPGSDGTPTFCRTHGGDTKRLEWLGATSMPRSSAFPIIKSLDAFAGGANGLGLSIGTGFEWAAFVQKLSRAQMLYVYEPDVTLLRMTFEMCDLAGQIATRRIVLISGNAEQAAADFADFLTLHIGFEPPAVLHPLPTLIGSRKNEMLTAGESIVRRGVLERQTQVARLYQSVSEEAAKCAASPERPMALLLSPRYHAERPLHPDARHKNATIISLDHHATASVALRLQRLADILADGQFPVISSDLFRAQLGALPAEILVETWIPPLAGPETWDRVPALATFAPRDRILVHSGYHADLLAARGFAAERLVIRPVSPLHTAAPPAPTGAKTRIALIADLPPSDAESLGIVLPTHQAVFAAAREAIQSDYLTVHPGMASDILRRAMTRAGVDPRADDPALKEPMLRIIRDVLIPTLPLLTLAGKIVDQSLPLTLIGDWPGLDAKVARGLSTRIVPFSAYTLNTWDDVAILAHLSPTGVVSPLLWDAVLTSTAIIAPRHTADAQLGSLSKLLKPEQHFFHTLPQQFQTSLKSLFNDSARRQSICKEARKAF